MKQEKSTCSFSQVDFPMEAAGIESFNNSPEKATALLPSAAESAANDLEGPPPYREAIGRRLPQRSTPFEEGNEAVRSEDGAIQDASKVRHHDQTERQVNQVLPHA